MAFQGALLKKWRLEKNLSQAAAGETVHVSQGFWREMEVGYKQPSIDTLVLIAQVTGFSTDVLLGNPISDLPEETAEEEGTNLRIKVPPERSEIAAEIIEFRAAILDLFPDIGDKEQYANILLDLSDNGRIDDPEIRRKVRRGAEALLAALA